ncbi:MORC family CW-type zinc finger protein 3-like isoform X3 [Tachysurus fulvidraco]|uniref:MORC family CW-type zinc finger protein 3-like isoform X3 n=1 Tax=Tachysurus fulvidraco TaxID=1234273 RepID=UPI001FEDD40C|nr:MORC family CW-type zinc finger protein 3-like isoform X3 [Tachysurus fulvidraco]
MFCISYLCTWPRPLRPASFPYNHGSTDRERNTYKHNNAYDPDVSAKQIWIDKTVFKDQDCLIFMDNGKGMDYDKMHKMLSFGFSDKQAVKGHVPVGLYGNGFKSGSMRLGKDAIVFSKKNNTMCVGLLSQTYLERTGAQNVIVPIVAFTTTGETVGGPQKYEECLHDILTHSLFSTKEELLTEFRAINGPHGTNSTGTRIIIWNLRRMSSGELEFDFLKDRYDIRLPVDVNEVSKEPNNEPESQISPPESEYSLRAYSSILYLKPKMQIIIRGQEVKTQLISKSLAYSIKDTYKPTFLKKRIKITFGYNTKSKEHYGLMMYHKKRLIKAYEPAACQRKANKIGVRVIGVIKCDYLTPMHNKQDFEKTEEYRKTMQNVSTKLEEYWKEVRYRHQKSNCSVPVEEDVEKPDQNWVQCDGCLNWRKLPDGIDLSQLPTQWFCYMNPDPQFRICTVEEEPEDSDDELRYQKIYKQESCTVDELEDSDDEQPRNQKTYKHDEKNQKLQKEKNRQQSPVQGTPDSLLNSNPQRHASFWSHQVPTPWPFSSRKKRAMGPSQENEEMKRARIRDCFGSNTQSRPSTSTASPEFCSSPILDNCDGNGDQAAWKDNKTSLILRYPALKLEKEDTEIMEKEQWSKNGKNDSNPSDHTQVESLEKVHYNLTTSCESLKKALEDMKREIEKVKVFAEDRVFKTNFPICSHEECTATAAETSNSGRGTDNSTLQTYKLKLRELRQTLARLLVTLAPDLDLQHVNYDCDAIDEILVKVVNEMSPAETAST